ncbi:helix-turn-helix domain-containing protein [Enterococcus pseudoavium]|uniref:Helix-turn-helix domain-containing protein n=1 Tax=Enterococcus pseudoavium TaxID=44007 RepID=A0AAE4I129_9ENTE|nr:helix-turn-helix domain-containing protein [Enterococcus pseudoavium]MDT2735851.1 helix-turn-helix domain-containing protein [Enterococcus pseudoavium]
MLGMDKNTLLKIQIIETLDRLSAPISLKELQLKIEHASLGTIRMNCKELQTIIAELYKNKDYSLKLCINNGGIQLERSSSNLQSLAGYLYQQDLACQIIRAILVKRKISAIQFCMAKNISESKLRRKIKEINRELADYELYISCSANISLKGREVDIRRFYYIFLRGLYQQFAMVGASDTDSYYQLSQQIEADLKLTDNPANREMISFWLLITNQFLNKKADLTFTRAEQEWLNQFKFPNKPPFLKTWNTNEWKFFLHAIYSSLLNDFELQTKNPSQDQVFSQAATHWIAAFTNNFRPLNHREQKFITRKIKQLYAALVFFNLNDDMLNRLSDTLSLNTLQTQFPYYHHRFEAFWDKFTQEVSWCDQQQLKLYSLLTCVSLFPLENCLPNISIYVFSEYSELFSILIREKIQLHFKNQYHLDFVAEPQTAQLIIGTSPACRNFLVEGQEFLIIRSNLSATDYKDIEVVLTSLVAKDLAESSKKLNLG